MQSIARITAIGAYVPEKVLTNKDLEKIVETTDEWIVQRTGIHERRIVSEGEFASTIAIRAVDDLLAHYSKQLDDVDCVIVSTSTGDYVMPGVASLVQAHFKIPHTAVFDFNTACSGFTYALHFANGLITAGLHKKILVITTETMSKIIDYTDRSTCILFGDGAAALLVEKDVDNGSFITSCYGTEGASAQHLYCTALSGEMYDESLKNNRTIVQNGGEVYKWATRTVRKAMKKLTDEAHTTFEGIDWFVPHSANLRMIQSICEKSGFPFEKTLTSMEQYGNTSSASIPLALYKGIIEGKLKDGDTLMLIGFGAGLTHTGHIVKWDLSARHS